MANLRARRCGMSEQVHPQSLLGRIMALVPDPRGRRGRRFPLVGIVAMLLLGALEGEGSLRGMWLRGRKYWAVLVRELADLGLPVEPPALSTVWFFAQRLDAEALEEALGGWVEGVEEEEALSVDGKVLRGSRRGGGRALEVLVAMGQRMGQVWGQRVVEGGEEAAVLALLRALPLEGKAVTLDAGPMERPVVKAIGEKGGTTLGC